MSHFCSIFLPVLFSLSFFLLHIWSCCQWQQVGDATDTIVPEAGAASMKHHNHHHHHHHHHHHSSGGKKKRTSVHESLSSAELFSLYNMLNGVKVDLLWGRNDDGPNDLDDVNQQCDNACLAAATQTATTTTTDVPSTANTNTTSTTTGSDNGTNNGNASQSSTKEAKGHARRPSTASVASSNSTTTLSDSDSEISTENDSGIESECKHGTDKSRDLAKQYRKHLLGLYRCLEQMTDAANYLTARYQSDIGPV